MLSPDPPPSDAGLGPPSPPPPPRPIRWREARRALRQLIREPERTDQVFALIGALGGNSGERLFQRFRVRAEGRRLLRERPCLLEVLADRERLRTLPPESFGAAYARFMGEQELRAEGLAEAAQTASDPDRAELDPERRWFYDRLRDMHDLWHVLTGYGRDVAGEAANLAFTHAQTRNRGIGAIVLAAAWLGPGRPRFAWQRYLARAWWRGHRCRPLVLAPYEELLPLPLDDVRRRLAIEDPRRAHPGGILVFGGGGVSAP